MPEPSWPPLIAGLLQARAYRHPAPSIRLAETHISWVVLVGAFAYKIKKPVNFGFLDFSTLERRRFCCEEELRLNRRHAPDLYLAVVPVTGSPDHPRMGGNGPPFEYAVQMRRFDDGLVFDRLQSRHRVLPAHTDALAETLAAFHSMVARAVPADPHGLPERQRDATEANFTALLAAGEGSEELTGLWTWTHAEFARRAPLLGLRKLRGFIRECHGDLHLGNIVLIEGQPTFFDGIEFNEDLRWIDVLNETAFLAMDLEAHGEPALAYRFLNRYLERTGDYTGLPLLDYFRVYRALVRAKVLAIQRGQAADAAARADLVAGCRRYVAFATGLARPRRGRLCITHGVSGSGKSHLARLLSEHLPAIRLRSDAERKRLAGLDPESPTATPPPGLYGPESTRRTYGQLTELAGLLLHAGHSVIVDAAFLTREQREAQRRIAEQSGTKCLILACHAPMPVLRERIQTRAQVGFDPSDANLSVLDEQAGRREALTEEEESRTLSIDTAAPLDLGELLSRISGG